MKPRYFNHERAQQLLKDASDETTPAVLLIAAIVGAVLAMIVFSGRAHAHEPRHHYGLVASINAKLQQYVHRSGRCPGQEWLATYYGFESGNRTASGQRFRPLGLTAAHRKLPFGTQPQVTNPRTGRSVSVTVNDRGPFTHANIDLSLGAARSIGMTQSAYVCVSM